jgi:hypothetical protein
MFECLNVRICSPIHRFTDKICNFYRLAHRRYRNILDNTRQVMGNQGEIIISTRHKADRRFLNLENADNGPGISDEDRQKVFQPYSSKKRAVSAWGWPSPPRSRRNTPAASPSAATSRAGRA